MTNEYAVGHYFKRVTMIDQLYGDADTHLCVSGRAWRSVRQGCLSGKLFCSTWTARWRIPRPGIEACFRHMLAELGHDPAVVGDVTWAVGPPIAVSIGTLLGKFGDDRVELGLATYRARYTTVGIYECAAFPGYQEMLAALKDAGRTLCVRDLETA